MTTVDAVTLHRKTHLLGFELFPFTEADFVPHDFMSSVAIHGEIGDIYATVASRDTEQALYLFPAHRAASLAPDVCSTGRTETLRASA